MPERRPSTLQSSGSGAGADEIGRRIAELGPWFHNLHLPTGHQTAPDHPLGDFPRFKWDDVADALPQDLTGWRVLDVGCNAGFYTFELARRGGEVLGIDHDDHYLEQARWAADQIETEGTIRFERLGVYDLIEVDESFDLILFLGVLYHLRYPLLALDVVASKVERLLVMQTLSMPGEATFDTPEDLPLHQRDAFLQRDWPKMAFIEHKLAADHTNWWSPNGPCIEAMLRSTGMRVVARPAHEFYVAEPGSEPRNPDLEAIVRGSKPSS